MEQIISTDNTLAEIIKMIICIFAGKFVSLPKNQKR